MSFNLGIIGAGQFAGQFATLFAKHPLVNDVLVTDLIPERAVDLAERTGLAGVMPDYTTMLQSPNIDAVAVFTQRWTHGQMSAEALAAGKHVYSAVPMGTTVQELETIVDLVDATGLVYMMGETTFYNPTTVYVRELLRDNRLGRVFYSEGDYVHDMDNGFFAAYEYSGGPEWRRTASFPPMLYPTHAIGGALGALDVDVVSVSCLGVKDEADDGVFDRSYSMFDNDFSNASAHFHLSDGGILRTNEFRRVGYPSHTRESRFRFFGTEASLETLATVSLLSTKTSIEDITELLHASSQGDHSRAQLKNVDPALEASFVSGFAPAHATERLRLPAEFTGASNGHEGSHQFLADDFATAVASGLRAPVNERVAYRFTAPGIVAHESARNDGDRLSVPTRTLPA